MDFADVRAAFEPSTSGSIIIISTTSGARESNSGTWLAGSAELQPRLAQLSRVVVHETCTSGASYGGEQKGIGIGG